MPRSSSILPEQIADRRVTADRQPELNGHPSKAAKRRSRRRSFSGAVMHWVRRIHLYSGLFMFPWVMLYGTTALLFNHPGAFPDRPQRTLHREDFAGTRLEQMANPAADAEAVVAALNAKFGADAAAANPFRLVEPGRASYASDVIDARARGAGQEHSVLLDLPSGTARVSTLERSDAEQPPFAVRGLRIPGSLGDRVKAGLPAALTRAGLAADDAGIAVGTDLVFFVDAGGTVWRAAYNIQTGAVTGRPADAPGDPSLRTFLTELHLAHGFPSEGVARWFWAVSVDAMFVSMVFWGVSGLFMWWQIKVVRSLGAAVLIASLVVATLLGFCMHRVLTAM